MRDRAMLPGTTSSLHHQRLVCIELLGVLNQAVFHEELAVLLGLSFQLNFSLFSGVSAVEVGCQLGLARGL